jgi:hypothetical protein
MKKVIEMLEQALALIWNPPTHESEKKFRDVTVSNIIKEAIKDLQTPRWYTPEQWEAETGELWPDKGAVYYRYSRDYKKYQEWQTGYYRNILNCKADFELSGTGTYQIICATEAGPPLDNWQLAG